MGTGRKTILNKQIEELICKATEEVYYITVACESVGISYQTVKNWIKLAQDHEKQFHPEDEECDSFCEEKDVALRSFLRSYKRAKANYLKDNVKDIKQHTKKNWMAAAWLNERVAPELYGLRTQQSLSVSGTVKHQHSLSIEQRQKALKAAQDSLIIDTEKEEDLIEAEILSQDE